MEFIGSSFLKCPVERFPVVLQVTRATEMRDRQRKGIILMVML